ncbi:hypothetical protein EJD97_019867 [Solanum chilense]|uniref:Uncharacterized protein n=1 Tax=Solanum chilense TaxID=4083 RepID=A0A6N2CD91_SOLCI|nr:hypothetical protein EJD97_019867 [Solanum chilense]
MKKPNVQYQDIILAQGVLHFPWGLTLQIFFSSTIALYLMKGRHMMSIVPVVPLTVHLRFLMLSFWSTINIQSNCVKILLML